MADSLVLEKQTLDSPLSTVDQPTTNNQKEYSSNLFPVLDKRLVD